MFEKLNVIQLFLSEYIFDLFLQLVLASSSNNEIQHCCCSFLIFLIHIVKQLLVLDIVIVPTHGRRWIRDKAISSSKNFVDIRSL